MNKGFWAQLKRPIMSLAPMAEVTDAAFRRIIAKYGKPDVMWTEFVSADGLFLGGREKLIRDLEYTEGERPIVAQFFTARPDMMEKAAALAAELGFDGVDINMGCPDRGIERQGAGAALIRSPKLAREIIAAARRGAGSLPVSVKTRLGWNKDELEGWLQELLAEKPAVVTIHARTRKEMSKVPARWERVKRAVEIRNASGTETIILGNGDTIDLSDADAKISETGVDGVMLGRAIFGKPWLFSRTGEYDDREDPAVRAKVLRIMVEHTKLFEELFGLSRRKPASQTGLWSESVSGGHKSFAIMKKHYKEYVSGFHGAADLRARFMECESATEVEIVAERYVETGEVLRL